MAFCMLATLRSPDSAFRAPADLAMGDLDSEDDEQTDGGTRHQFQAGRIPETGFR